MNCYFKTGKARISVSSVCSYLAKMGIDYYGVLGIKKCSFDIEISEAYRRLILQYNPERQNDKNLQDLFIAVSEAYDCLSNPLYRAVYDQYGEEGLKGGVQGPEGYIQPYVYHGDPLRTYREFFGTESPYPDLLEAKPPICSSGKPQRQKEEPIKRPLFLTLHEIFHGGIKRLKIQRFECTDNDCNNKELREKVLDIPIKPGIMPDTEIIFKEEGDQDPAVIPADVIFIIKDRPHPKFERVGTDIIMTCKVTLEEALIGCVIKVETLDGRILRVPITDIISPDYEKVIEHEGMPDVTNPNKKGNMILRFKIRFPNYLPKGSKMLIKKAINLAKVPCDANHIHQLSKLILADKMNQVAKDERLPE